MRLKFIVILLLVALTTGCSTITSPPEPTAVPPTPTPEPTPSVPQIEVSNQPVSENIITIDRIFALQQGWVVVRSDRDGQPGAIAGWAPIQPGEALNIGIPLFPDAITTTMYVTIHRDEGEIGAYEPDIDPAITDESGNIIRQSFTVQP